MCPSFLILSVLVGPSDRLRLPDCSPGSILGDRRQSVPSDCLLGLIRTFPGPLLLPFRARDATRVASNRTLVSYMISGEKSSSRLPFRCHPALAWESSRVASRKPVNHAPCTVEGWYLVVCSPAKSTLGLPRRSQTGSARVSYSLALCGSGERKGTRLEQKSPS